MSTKILSPLVFSRHDDIGQAEVRLITRTAESELRVYSRESVTDANKEMFLEVCQVYQVVGGSAQELAQSMINDWRRTGFSQINSTGRAFDPETRTLSEGLNAVISDTMGATPVMRSPFWFF